MNYIEIGLLIIIPYIVYAVILHWLENKYDININKMGKAMIFMIIDLVIFMIANYLQ